MEKIELRDQKISNPLEILTKILFGFLDKEDLNKVKSFNKAWHKLADKEAERRNLAAQLYKHFSSQLEEQIFDCYVPPVGQLRNGDEKHLLLLVESFIQSPKHLSLAIFGDSGLGKSTFAQYLTLYLWKKYCTDNWLPLLIYLPTIPIEERRHELLDDYFIKCGLSKADRTKLKIEEKLLLILDGRDELSEVINLWEQNGWRTQNVKVITFCRPEVLKQYGDNYQKVFYAPFANPQQRFASYEEIRLQPFIESQIDQYLKNYWIQHPVSLATQNRVDWKIYKQQIQQIPGLLDFIKTPFILSMVMHVLPEIVKDQTQKASEAEQIVITRTKIYDYFVTYWFEYQANRINKGGKFTEFGSLPTLLQIYSENLAKRLLKSQRLDVVIEESETLDKTLLYTRDKQLLSTYHQFLQHLTETDLKAIRSGCLLKTGEGFFQFKHKSLLEYFAAQDLFNGIKATLDISLQVLVKDKENFSLNDQLLVHEPEVLQKLADKVKEDAKLKERLFEIIDYSRKSELVANAAANAITALNYAEILLANQAFQGIQIPGADLSRAFLANTDFQGANLAKVNFHHACLRGANFKRAYLAEVNFGQRPAFINKNSIVSLCYSSDGKWLAVGDYAGYILLFDAATGQKKATLKNWRFGQIKDNTINGLSFHVYDKEQPIRTLLAAGSDDGYIRLWDINSLTCLHVFKGHSSYVSCVHFSPDGRRLVSGSWDRTIRLWNVEQRICIAELKGHTGHVDCVQFSPDPDGRWLASGSYDHSIRLWDVEQRACIAELKGQSRTHCIQFSPDGRWLAFEGCEEKAICLWNVEQRVCIAKLKEQSTVMCVQFSPDGRWLASGSFDNTIYLWDIEQRVCIAKLKGHTSIVSCVQFSPDGFWLASGSWDSTIRLWDMNHQQINVFKLKEDIFDVGCAKFSPNGRWLALGSRHDSAIRLWDFERKVCVATLQGHIKEVTCIQFSPDGRWLASGSYDGTIRLWDVKSQIYIAELKGYEFNGVHGTQFSPDGRWLVSYSWDKNAISLWDVERKVYVGKLNESSHTKCIHFSPDGRWLVSSSWDKTIYLWDIEQRVCIAKLKGHTSTVSCVQFSPDGRWLASISTADNAIRLWSVEHQVCVAKLKRQDNVLKPRKKNYNIVDYVQFSGDGRWLASSNFGDYDHSPPWISLWDVTDKTCRFILPVWSFIIVLQFMQAEQKIIAVDHDMNFYTWQWSYDINEKPKLLNVNPWGTWPLDCTTLNIEQSTGLSDENKRLLSQLGAIGLPSQRKAKYFQESEQLMDIESHQAIVPVTDKFSVVDSHMPVSYENWVVSLLRNPKGKYPDHAYIVVEGFNQFGQGILIKLHLVEDNSKSGMAFIGIGKYQGIAEHERGEIFRRDMADEGEHYNKSWSISRVKALALLNSAEADKDKQIYYHLTGDKSIFAKSKQSSVDGPVHNCYSWAREKLIHLNDDRIKLPVKFWEFITGAKTSFYINDNNQQEKKCLIM